MAKRSQGSALQPFGKKRNRGQTASLVEDVAVLPPAKRPKVSSPTKQTLMKKPAAKSVLRQLLKRGQEIRDGKYIKDSSPASPPPSAMPLRRRLYGKQRDPVTVDLTRTKRPKISGRSPPACIVEVEAVDEPSDVYEAQFVDDQEEGRMISPLEEPLTSGKPSDASGVSSAQLALTLLMSTMAAQQEPHEKVADTADVVCVGSKPVDASEHRQSCLVKSPIARRRLDEGRPPATPLAQLDKLSLKESHQSKKSFSSRKKAMHTSAKSSSSSSSSSSSDSEPAASAGILAPIDQSREGAAPLDVGLVDACLEKVRDAILLRLPSWPAENNLPSHQEVGELSREIAEAFVHQWHQVKNPRVQLRTLLWNLKSTQNPDFVCRVVERKFKPSELPTISSEQMASAAKQTERAILRERHLQETTLHRGLSGMMDKSAFSAYKALVSRK